MAVQPQTPYKEYTANGSTKSFSLGFDCESQDHLIVLVDDVEPVVGAWSLSGGSVVFGTAPGNGKKITIQRNTPFRRDGDFQSYDNSFRPGPVNKDFDRAWWKIQELGIADWLLGLKIQKFRDDVNLTALENTLKQSRDIRDATSLLADEVQANTTQSATLLTNTTAKANAAATSATNANTAKTQAQQAVTDANGIKTDMYTALYSFQNGATKAYPTLAVANADIANIALDTKVTVLSATDGGDYYKATAGATSLTKSPYDALQQAKDFANANANFNPVKIGDVSLDTLTQVGIYFATEIAFAKLENNYPLAGLTGIIHVARANNSTLVFQEFRSIQGTDYWRSWNNVSWSAWKLKIDLSLYELKSTALADRGILGTTTLDDVKTIGVYVQNVAASATSARGYPILQAGVLEVTKTESSTLTIQKYTSTNGKIFVRVFSTSWSAWLEHGGISVQQSNLGKITAVFSAAMNADELRSEFSYYLVNNNNLDIETTKLPIKDFGLLKIYRGTVSSFIIQEFVAGTGLVYTRYWNNVAWSSWKQVGQGGSASSDKIAFSKTATTLYFNLENSGSGENVIKHRFIRQTVSERNLDNWGMSTCSVVTKADTTVLNLTTNGVWEVAIIDSENVSDHSGGGHGDEVKFLSYFLVDGVKYDEDFTGILSAKEVKHVQHSVIYVEAQNIPICTRKTTWTFNKNGCTSKTKLDWAEGRNINKARIAMLPIYRKSNDDGTGSQITDTEIRSQDDQIINVAEHGFALRDLPITDGDSILLSSAVSNISAEVKVKKIVAQDPHAYVQNTILYNKVYVNGFKETAAPFVTGANDVWEIETDFVIKVRG